MINLVPAKLLWLLALLYFALPKLLLASTSPQAPPVIVVGGDHAYPPYEFINEEGNPDGYIVELTQAIAETMGFKVEIQLGDWSNARLRLQNGKVDILEGVAFLEERLNELDFSQPHSTIYQSIWVRTGSPINKLEDLRGKEVLVMRASVMHDFMRAKMPNVQLFATNTLADALTLLASGQHDCALVAKLPGEYLKQQLHLSNIQPIAKSVMEQPYGYGVHKGNQDLLNRFSNGLVLLKESGRYKKIHHKWLGILEPRRVSWHQIVAYSALIVVPLLLILAGTVLWSRTLKRKVDERTAQLSQEVAERKKAVEELQLRQRQLLQADKMTSLGILVAGVAHEINNPNGLITLNLPLISRAWQDAQPILERHYQQHGDFKLGWLNYSRMCDEIPHLLTEMQACSKSIKSIVNDLKDFTRRDDSTTMSCMGINSVVQTAIRLLDNQIKKSTYNFNCNLGTNLPQIQGSAQRLEQVVINLLLNACQSLQNTEQAIWVTTQYNVTSAELCIRVQDEGCGISADKLEFLMDPFFTTKREHGGTGLGLSVSAGIAKSHGGRLEFSSAPDSGMIATLYLPQGELNNG